jgi:hypothetical protein
VHPFSKEREVKKCDKCSQFQKGRDFGGKDKKKEKTNHSIRECGWRIKTICPLMAVSSFVGR